MTARLVLAGDVMLGRLVNLALRTGDFAFPWGDTLSIFGAADWKFCNLECVLSDLVPAELPHKTFHFRSDRRNAAVLKAAGIDAVSIANNHSLDFGEEALMDMLASLEAEGIGHAGAGANLEQAMRPALSITRTGITIGVLACTDNEPGWAASEAKPGVWFVPPDPGDERAQQLLHQVRRLHGLSHLGIVSLHWGSNWGTDPEPGHRELAQALVRAGADLVFGHSCHVLRGVEIHEDALVVYGAGDFIDDYAVDEVERNDRSLLFIVDVERGRPARLKLQPTVICKLQARLADGREAGEILEKVRRICGRLGTRVVIAGGQGTVTLESRRGQAGNA
jgi:poly-gamma-glutamate capsule biosynthesis protein CapA/YwtB (metallophosphatase superfamily)